jgi:hypothetical protein
MERDSSPLISLKTDFQNSNLYLVISQISGDFTTAVVVNAVASSMQFYN